MTKRQVSAALAGPKARLIPAWGNALVVLHKCEVIFGFGTE
jgi:hypothetical protein